MDDSPLEGQEERERGAPLQSPEDELLGREAIGVVRGALERLSAIDADDEEGARLGLKGTPTLFVNGRRIIGAQPIDVLRASVDRALAAQ